MQSRTKTFLIFSLFCLLPVLAFSIIAFLSNLKFNERLLRSELQQELAGTASEFERSRRDDEKELQILAASSAIREYLNASLSQETQTNAPKPDSSAVKATPVANGEDVRAAMSRLLRYHGDYATIALFAPDKRLLFIAEPPQGQGEIVFRTTNLLADQIQPDEFVWSTETDEPRCSLVRQATLGKTLRCTTPAHLKNGASQRGALVVDIKLNSLLSPIARPSDPSIATVVTVVDDSGEIVYHPNDAIKHQHVNNAMPYFVPVASSMIAGEEGTRFYNSAEGDKWLAAYGPLMRPQLAIAVARNYSLLTGTTRLLGWLGILFAVVVGTVATYLLSNYYLRRTQSMDRVAEGVGAIAKGELDHRIDLRSSDNLRPLADNLGLMTQQLREQIARETESRQFDSFVRLSAILTHDLKNSIEALSLTVSNMERHFENAEFRADAMRTLRAATENLRSLVTRLSNPVTTLSGEHKRPTPSDLIPMLRRVISMTAAQAIGPYQTNTNLPDSLFALVDMERMERVVENLIINALEAMGGTGGTLTIEAGTTDQGKTFFSVSDTGKGMSRRFIEEKLFHPFATTKKRGVGLGLYTCREVVRANGGSIEVDSQEGVGTTFRVVLPSAATFKSGEIKHKQPQR